MATASPIDTYLAVLPKEQKKALENLRQTIKIIVPDAQEIISSRVPAFRYKDRYLVSFRASKTHLSFFVMRGDALKMLKKELTGYDTSNTVVRFSPEAPLPRSLIEKIVKIRMGEINSQKE